MITEKKLYLLYIAFFPLCMSRRDSEDFALYLLFCSQVRFTLNQFQSSLLRTGEVNPLKNSVKRE
jgi:hypothetical protein